MVPDIEYATYNDLDSVKVKLDDSFIAIKSSLYKAREE